MAVVLGITGPSGSGKSELSSFLSKMGFMIINADEVGHEVLKKEEVKREIMVEFEGVSDPFGEIDRKKLGKIVFDDKEKLKLLNIITHKHITNQIKDIIKTSNSDLIVIDAFELNSSGLSSLCNYTIAVIAPKEIRIKRIMERDHLSIEDAAARVNSQKSDSEFSVSCDFVIMNNEDVETLHLKMLKIFETIRN